MIGQLFQFILKKNKTMGKNDSTGCLILKRIFLIHSDRWKYLTLNLFEGGSEILRLGHLKFIDQFLKN
jgi:hypothetical protein